MNCYELEAYALTRDCISCNILFNRVGSLKKAGNRVRSKTLNESLDRIYKKTSFQMLAVKKNNMSTLTELIFMGIKFCHICVKKKFPQNFIGKLAICEICQKIIPEKYGYFLVFFEK